MSKAYTVIAEVVRFFKENPQYSGTASQIRESLILPGIGRSDYLEAMRQLAMAKGILERTDQVGMAYVYQLKQGIDLDDWFSKRKKYNYKPKMEIKVMGEPVRFDNASPLKLRPEVESVKPRSVESALEVILDLYDEKVNLLIGLAATSNDASVRDAGRDLMKISSALKHLK